MPGVGPFPKSNDPRHPELEAKQENLEMSHEAAVGKIAEKEILYLMSRGLSERRGNFRYYPRFP